MLTLGTKTLAPVFARTPRKGPHFIEAALSSEPITEPADIHTAIRFGSFTQQGSEEIILLAQMDAPRNWSEMVWHLRFEHGSWRILQRLDFGSGCIFDTVDVDGDQRWEVLTECGSGGGGVWGSGAELVRLTDHGKTVLYRNQSQKMSTGFGHPIGLVDVKHRIGFVRPPGTGPLLLYQHRVRTYFSCNESACLPPQRLEHETQSIRVLRLDKGKYILVPLPKDTP